MRYIISSILATLPFAAMAEVPKVITDIPPVHALVSQVMGDLGTPVLLLEKGADEHDFQLRPSQMRDITGADLVVWIGPDLTPWLARALQNAPAGYMSLTLLDLEGTTTIARSAAEGDQNAEKAVAESKPPAEEAGDDHGGIDLHAWLNPQNAIYWLDMIAAELAKADPPNAAVYHANAVTSKARIAAMDQELQAMLAPVKNRSFVTFHDAYGYFVAQYGLSFAGSVAVSDASAPGAARLRALQDTLGQGVICAFPEVQHDPALLMQLLQGTNVRAGAAIDPVGSSLPFGPDAYDTLMRNLATHLLDCLKGA